MESGVYDVLKEKLGDTKIKVGDEEKPLLDTVVYWEEGVEKTKAANKDLTAQREAWEAERKSFKEQFNELTSTKEELTKKLEDLSKNSSNKSSEKEAEFQKQINALTDKLDTLQNAYNDSQKQVEEQKQNALQANKKASEEGLRNDLITTLAKYKIEGDKAGDAIDIIVSKGWAKLIQNSENGLYERSFCTTKDSKQLTATMDQMCKWIADTKPHLVSSSGSQGTGKNHNSSGPASTGGGNYFAMLHN